MAATQPQLDHTGRKSRVEQIIETLADGLGNGIGFLANNWILFGIFAALWLAFGEALLLSQGSVDSAWQWVRSLPLLLQVGVWVLFLPVVAGLWVWESTWPLLVRLVLVAGLAGWNLLVLIPRAAARA